MTNEEIIKEIEEKHAHPPMLVDSMISECMDEARRDEREKMIAEGWKKVTITEIKFQPKIYLDD